ncbi:MAG: twin-arginine translocase TatA/TatE family subunit [bacterium]|nr:twin-arginine translocase TatA/TatE family subunit [bacterium]MDT8396168.1 twin-arginine translocase TatA/TatE family subunit [bacterium]
MIYGLGMQELLVILAIVMLLFGGKRLPEVGRNLGKAIRGFKQAEDEATKEIRKTSQSARTTETNDSATEPEVTESEDKPAEDEPATSDEEPTEKPA